MIDTGAAQTLLLEGVLPFSEQTFTGRTVLAGGKVVPDPIVRERVTSNVTSDDEDDDFYPACAVTRAMTIRQEMDADILEEQLRKIPHLILI